VNTPLVDNAGHIAQLCAGLGIGRPKGAPSRVYGGLHHTMWRLETTAGTYAVKQLSADADIGDPDTVRHYNVTEKIAETFALLGVPAVFALRGDTQYLQVTGDEGYLVYPWNTGAALAIRQVSVTHALAIARILATMHRADIRVCGAELPRFDVHSEEMILDLVERSGSYGSSIAPSLRGELPALLAMVHAQKSAINVLGKNLVLSHGDLDQKNVLWDSAGRPAIIDWESAHRLNPTYEILLQALNWSGIGSRLDPLLFRSILSAYVDAGGVFERESVDASLSCILGDWVNWLMYNVGRCLDPNEPDQQALGRQQVGFALTTLRRLREELPLLIVRAGIGAAAPH
jgi:aminoglycoside phosphotransferase (APT) family kinase protein